MRFNKAQSLAEYALLATIVIASLVGMQVYVKRGLQARVKTFVDGSTSGVSSLAELENLQQYEPYYIHSDITTDAKQKVTTTHTPGGSVRYDYAGGSENEVKRQGEVIVKGTSDDELKQDDDWEK